MPAGRMDLTVPVRERYDIDFQLIAGTSSMSISGWSPVFTLYSGFDVIATSAGTDPDVWLESEPGAQVGFIAVHLGVTLVETFLKPFHGNSLLSYRLDLVDDGAEDNIIPCLRGDILLEDS